MATTLGQCRARYLFYLPFYWLPPPLYAGSLYSETWSTVPWPVFIVIEIYWATLCPCYSSMAPRVCRGAEPAWPLGSWPLGSQLLLLIDRKTEVFPTPKGSESPGTYPAEVRVKLLRFSTALDSWLAIEKKLHQNVSIHFWVPREFIIKSTKQFPLFIQLSQCLCTQRQQVTGDNLSLGSQSFLGLWKPK